jgi:adenosylmethionine-8-amino-7-oxononanoate aminotransferase
MQTDARRYAFVSSGGPGPLAVERAEGPWLYRAGGGRILDAAGGAIVANIGHGRREVVDAMAEAAAREGYVVPVFATESRLRLVERLQEHWLPDPLDRVHLTSGGSEAVDAALRLVRQHFVARGEPERWKVIGRDVSYHGATLATLSVGGHTKRRAPMGPLLIDLPKAPACLCAHCPFDRRLPECGIACADAVEQLILDEGPETVAAVIAEPVTGSAGGAVAPPDEYWPRLRSICDRHGVLLVADEVMTGFGRTGRRFAVEHWNVTPDVLVGGKGLAGGYAPLGGVYTHAGVVEPLAARGEDLMFHTFGAHPAACAAADKVLEIMQREDGVKRFAERGAALRDRLRPLEDHPHVLEIRGLGLMIGIELVRDRARAEPFAPEDGFTARVVAAGLGEGVFFYPCGVEPVRDAVMLGPPYGIGDAEIDLIAVALERAIDSAARYTLSGGSPG